MVHEGVEQTAKRFVRKHSWKVAADMPNNELAQAVDQFENNLQSQETRVERQRLEWQRWLQFEACDQEDDVADLEIECKELVLVWQEFKSRFSGPGISEAMEDEVPSIWTVKKAVELTVEDWEARQEKGLGKAKQFLVDYCDTLVAHSNLFAIFPQGDKYTSLFTGVTSSIIHAFARHKENAEGFSKALLEISDDMRFTRRQGLIHVTPQMKKLVVMLYIKYFKFLCHTMDWFTSKPKRFKAALNQNFYTKQVEEKVAEIKSIVTKIQQEASLQTQGTIEATHSQVMNLVTTDQMNTCGGNIVQYISDRFQLADKHRYLSDQELGRRLDLLTLQLGEVAQKAAVAAVEKVMYEQKQRIVLGTKTTVENTAQVPTSDIGPSTSTATGQPHQQITIGSTAAKTTHDRREVEFESRVLERFIDPEDHDDDIRSPQLHESVMSGEIVSRLQQWISAPSSKVLWLMGAPLSSIKSDETNAAVHVLRLARDSGILCISFFCEGKLGSAVSLSTLDPERRLVSLLYFLVRQLALSTPELFEDDCDYQAEFSQMDGTRESIPRALAMIRRLLGIAPRLLLFIIDGLQRLDQRATSGYIEELLNILMNPAGDQVIKLLLTTRGFFPAGAQLSATDRLVCSRLPRKQQGRGQTGARSIQSLKFP